MDPIWNSDFIIELKNLNEQFIALYNLVIISLLFDFVSIHVKQDLLFTCEYDDFVILF